MTIPAKKIYPRTMDKQTVYLDAVVTNPAIEIGAYTCLLYTSGILTGDAFARINTQRY